MGTSSSKPKTRKKRSGSEPLEPSDRNAPTTDDSTVRHTLPRYSLADVPNSRSKPSGSNDVHNNANPRASMPTESARLTDLRVILSKLCAVKPKYSVLQDMDWSTLDSRTQYLLFEAACELLDQDRALIELDKLHREVTQVLKQRNEEIKKLSGPLPPAIMARKALGNLAGHTRSASHDITSEFKLQNRLTASTHAVDNFKSQELADDESTAAVKMRTDQVEKIVFLYSRLEILGMNFKNLLDQVFKTDAARASALTSCVYEALELAAEAHNCVVSDVVKRLMNPCVESFKSVDTASEMLPRKSAILDQIQKLESIQHKQLDVNSSELSRKKISAERFVRDYLLRESSSLATVNLMTQLDLKWRKRFELTSGHDVKKEFCEACAQFAWRAVCLDEVQLDCNPSTFSDILHNTYRCTKNEGASVEFYVWPILRRKDAVIALYKGRVKLL